MAKSLSRERFLAWCAELPAGCLAAMEACGGAHHVARRLRLLGLDARLIAGHFVTPYRMAGKSGNNDANDAEPEHEQSSGLFMACEGSARWRPTRPASGGDLRGGGPAADALRAGEDGLAAGGPAQRAPPARGLQGRAYRLINRTRGVLAYFGLVYPQSPEALRRVLAEVLEDAGNELTGIARLVLQRAHPPWIDLDLQMKWCDERI